MGNFLPVLTWKNQADTKVNKKLSLKRAFLHRASQINDIRKTTDDQYINELKDQTKAIK